MLLPAQCFSWCTLPFNLTLTPIRKTSERQSHNLQSLFDLTCWNAHIVQAALPWKDHCRPSVWSPGTTLVPVRCLRCPRLEKTSCLQWVLSKFHSLSKYASSYIFFPPLAHHNPISCPRYSMYFLAFLVILEIFIYSPWFPWVRIYVYRYICLFSFSFAPSPQPKSKVTYVSS